MKLISITTQHLDKDGRVDSISSTIYNRKEYPILKSASYLYEIGDPSKKGAAFNIKDVIRHIVTFKTTRGQYVLTYGVTK